MALASSGIYYCFSVHFRCASVFTLAVLVAWLAGKDGISGLLCCSMLFSTVQDLQLHYCITVAFGRFLRSVLASPLIPPFAVFFTGLVLSMIH